MRVQMAQPGRLCLVIGASLTALTLLAGCGSGGGTAASSSAGGSGSSAAPAASSSAASSSKSAPAAKPLQGEVSAAYAASPPPLTGPATAWKTTPTIANQSSDVLRGADEWGGPSADTFTLYAEWDQKNLYLGAQVVQDHPYSNTYTAGDVWKGDTLWLYFTKTAGDQANVAKLTFTQAGDGPEVYDWQANQLVKDAQMKLAASGNSYWVAGQVPWSDLGVTPSNGLKMGVNVGFGFGKSGFIDLNGKDPDNDAADAAPMTLQAKG